ncbi:conserved protein of unknown function [Ectopseudomonas oleovorans]|uniref:Uncharacterized protein n=1 Tax=Ectopseudomonas oleovorans TaxID=301 RepID=A0A653BC62_ECTOL|nr:conserved protein of unknown function [Pseudomonas oleovorans]
MSGYARPGRYRPMNIHHHARLFSWLLLSLLLHALPTWAGARVVDAVEMAQEPLAGWRAARPFAGLDGAGGQHRRNGAAVPARPGQWCILRAGVYSLGLLVSSRHRQ